MASSGMQGSCFQGDPDAPPARSAGATLAIDDMPPSAPRLRHDLVLWMVALRRITVLAGLSLATLELALLGVSELGGIVAHFGSGGFYRPEAYGEWGFVVLVIMAVTTVDALCAYLSHYLSGLLGVQEERSRALAAARADLLARNEREAARVRVLLEVAQHVSAMHTVEALLRAVCETTVALVRVPRVEIFLWDAERQGLCLAAAHGLAVEPGGAGEVRYTADLPIVGRLP